MASYNDSGRQLYEDGVELVKKMNQDYRKGVKEIDMKIMFHDKPTCPKCGSYNVDGGFIEIDMGDGGQIAWQKVHCDDCGFEYTDVYRYDHSECHEDGE